MIESHSQICSAIILNAIEQIYLLLCASIRNVSS